ncbi:hypothetical protein Anapl_16382 [Anas platyrhynchos]|uniref:Uncharacterized protein n=1 Tax=Anas platyrhynchos TaxID=8839 RepID=R0LAF3_ANAPL|nr:hypothetical protein Anapl_16382 [Anas platyrhynchos]
MAQISAVRAEIQKTKYPLSGWGTVLEQRCSIITLLKLKNILSCFFLLLSKQEHYEAVQRTLTSENHPLQSGLCQICSPVPLLTQTPVPSKKGWCRSKNEQLGKAQRPVTAASSASNQPADPFTSAPSCRSSSSLEPQTLSARAACEKQRSWTRLLTAHRC